MSSWSISLLITFELDGLGGTTASQPRPWRTSGQTLARLAQGVELLLPLKAWIDKTNIRFYNCSHTLIVYQGFTVHVRILLCNKELIKGKRCKKPFLTALGRLLGLKLWIYKTFFVKWKKDFLCFYVFYKAWTWFKIQIKANYFWFQSHIRTKKPSIFAFELTKVSFNH